MITLKGKTKNIKDSIVCKIALESTNVINPYPTFLYTSQIPEKLGSFNGIILNSNDSWNESLDISVAQIDSKEDFFKEGDIALISPNGYISCLFQSQSYTNSLFLTEKCSCKCIMCPQPPKNKDTIDYVDIAIRSVKLMNGNIKELGITGGEPTIVWSGLLDVIKTCKQYIPNTNIQLLTNARIFKDYEKAKNLADAAGERLYVGVPLYADYDDLHDKIVGRKGSFWDTLDGIYNLERAGVFIELRTVITKMNYMRLPQFAEFIYRSMPFVGHIALMALEPIGWADKNIEEIWIDPIDYSSEIENAVKILWQRDMNISLYNYQLCLIPKHLWHFYRKSISEWKIIYKEECEQCSVKQDCGGFFFSTRKIKYKGINPI